VFDVKALKLVWLRLFEIRAPFWSESRCHLRWAIDFAGLGHTIH